MKKYVTTCYPNKYNKKHSRVSLPQYLWYIHWKIPIKWSEISLPAHLCYTRSRWTSWRLLTCWKYKKIKDQKSKPILIILMEFATSSYIGTLLISKLTLLLVGPCQIKRKRDEKRSNKVFTWVEFLYRTIFLAHGNPLAIGCRKKNNSVEKICRNLLINILLWHLSSSWIKQYRIGVVMKKVTMEYNMETYLAVLLAFKTSK